MLPHSRGDLMIHDDDRAGATDGSSSCGADGVAAARPCGGRGPRGCGDGSAGRRRLAVVCDIPEIAAGRSGAVRDPDAADALPGVWIPAAYRPLIDVQS